MLKCVKMNVDALENDVPTNIHDCLNLCSVE